MILLISITVALSLVILYVWLTWNFNYWKKRNIPYLEPTLVFGNLKDFVLMKKCKGLVFDDLYGQGNGPVLGVFSMRKPEWLIRDPGLIKMIAINEFSNFKENDIYTEESDFFFSTNIFFTSGEKWKKKRSIITPALTSSKLKLFVPYMTEIAKEMITYIEDNKDKAIEAKSFAVLFTMETAMSYVYGVKCDSFKNPDSEYRKIFLSIFDPNWWNGFKFAVATAFPIIGHLFKIGITPPKFVEFYTNLVKEAVELKMKSDMKRKDFLQYCIDSSGRDGVPELSIYDMTGLTMNIAADGTETTSVALVSVIDALTRYPEHQNKLRDEIDEKIGNIDEITYDNINSIDYLDAFITESLRIFTPVPLLEKKCTNSCDIEFEGKTYKFTKGDVVGFSHYSIHMDPKYYENPKEFNPERFLQSEPESAPFLTFGSGPRMCLGKRLAFIQMKVFLCALLKHYQVVPKDGESPKLDFSPNSTFLLATKNGVWFRLIKR